MINPQTVLELAKEIRVNRNHLDGVYLAMDAAKMIDDHEELSDEGCEILTEYFPNHPEVIEHVIVPRNDKRLGEIYDSKKYVVEDTNVLREAQQKLYKAAKTFLTSKLSGVFEERDIIRTLFNLEGAVEVHAR